MKVCAGEWSVETAANRTNLELKYVSIQSYSWTSNLPIAPIWNWNVLSMSIWILAPHSANRTNLELKFLLSNACHTWWNCQSHQSGIEIKIGNNTCTDLGAANRTNLELKSKNLAQIPRFRDPANRTNLELKCTPLCDTAFLRCCQSHQSGIEMCEHQSRVPRIFFLPIAPIWNWNVNGTLPNAVPPIAANRTNLELKSNSPWLIRSCLKSCQSHQSGIEM